MGKLKNKKLLSLLIFSKDDIKRAFGLAISLINVVDQIVIIDSSNHIKHKRLIQKAKPYCKIKIYYVPPLGHVEPLRPYGISKCKGEWILYLDTDERINNKFKKELRDLINRSDTNGYFINRLTVETESGSFTSKYTDNQLRLYKKNKVKYNGYIHEIPAVKGKITQLDHRYFIKHIPKRIQFKKEMYKYIPIEIYEKRLSYDQIINRAKNPFIKFLIIVFCLGKNKSHELSKFEYFIYAFCILFYLSIYSIIKAKRIEPAVFQIFNRNLRKINYIFSLNEYQKIQTFFISREIYEAGGPINYLGLNKNIGQKLKYKDSENKSWKYLIPINDKGLKVFIRLLEQKYHTSKDYKKFNLFKK